LGIGDHWIIETVDRVPFAGSLVLPKETGITDEKLVPAMVQPVTVVATPAVSWREMERGKPGCALLDFTSVTTTFEPETMVTVTVPVEPARAVVPA
jgi:hypothetical protein